MGLGFAGVCGWVGAEIAGTAPQSLVRPRDFRACAFVNAGKIPQGLAFYLPLGKQVEANPVRGDIIRSLGTAKPRQIQLNPIQQR